MYLYLVISYVKAVLCLGVPGSLFVPENEIQYPRLDMFLLSKNLLDVGIKVTVKIKSITYRQGRREMKTKRGYSKESCCSFCWADCNISTKQEVDMSGTGNLNCTGNHLERPLSRWS